MSVTRNKRCLAWPGRLLALLWLSWATLSVAQEPATAPSLQQQLRALYLAQHYDQVIGVMSTAPNINDEASLSLLAASYSRLNQEPGYVQTLERLLVHHPKPKYWIDRLARLQQQANFSAGLGVELYRLQLAVGAMSSAAEYAEMAQLTQQAGFPAEALAVLEQGMTQGLIDPKDATSITQREKLGAMAREDKASIARSAARASTTQALSANGWTMATMGDYAGALPVLQRAVSANGSPAQLARAKLRLAHTQALAGQGEMARTTLSQVQGSDGSADLARLWTLHLLKATP